VDAGVIRDNSLRQLFLDGPVVETHHALPDFDCRHALLDHAFEVRNHELGLPLMHEHDRGPIGIWPVQHVEVWETRDSEAQIRLGVAVPDLVNRKAISTPPSTNVSSSAESTNSATPTRLGLGTTRSAARSDQGYPGAMARRAVDLQFTSETSHPLANAEETEPAELYSLSI